MRRLNTSTRRRRLNTWPPADRSYPPRSTRCGSTSNACAASPVRTMSSSATVCTRSKHPHVSVCSAGSNSRAKTRGTRSSDAWENTFRTRSRPGKPPPAPRAIPPSTRSANRAAPMFDYVIVGAGFAGSVLAERLARGLDQRVLLVDRRAHIGGNAYDCYDEHGILVHRYGPHIFHTNSAEIFDYLSRFTDWRQYQHRVRACVDGRLVPIPINLDTINELYGLDLDSEGMRRFLAGIAEKRDPIVTSEDVVLNGVGRELYEKFFRGYTRKQWGLDPSELDAQVTARVPVRYNRDDRYFTDAYQAMPARGFTHMFGNMLDHPNIKIMLNADYREVRDEVSFDQLIFTGPIDEYFDYRFGPLPYRCLEFKHETHHKPVFQAAPVVNYPNEY